MPLHFNDNVIYENASNYQSFMQISVLKRKGVASMFQIVPWHKLSIVCKIVCYVCSRAKRL